MQDTMIRLLEVNDPLTIRMGDELFDAWFRGPKWRDPRHIIDVTSRSEERTHLVTLPENVQFQRRATSPVGPPFMCDPCGHTWENHDDSGCLWMVCKCWLPGERK
jgi:hypothetical protein